MTKKTTLIKLSTTGPTGKNAGGKREISHDVAIAELFANDPIFAADYLNEVLSTGDQVDLLVALRQLTKAFGGVAQIAKDAGLNQTQLYRTLSEDGNPELRSFSAILKAMGLRLAVQPQI